jgi:hypothetical protein
MSINFLLQATRIIHLGNHDDTELQMIYDYVRKLDNEILLGYINTCTVLSYNNDLEFYYEIVDGMISIFEEKEEYEKCNTLLNKKQKTLELINFKKI